MRKQLDCLKRVLKAKHNTLVPLTNSVLKGKFCYTIIYKLSVEEAIASDNEVYCPPAAAWTFTFEEQ